jgi:tRNA dimethylallyltransferase
MRNKPKSKKTEPKQKILVVLGPTAVGKSDVAVKLAKRFNGEIISADSRQVYKGMDIGTGKITKKEMRGIPHYLLDVASPTARKRFTVAKFQTQAYKAIETILKKGKLPIICGGTGFYIQSIVDGTVLPDVNANEALRKKLNHKSAEELVKILSKKDKNRLKAIDPKNKFRLIRAIEIATALGKVPSLIKQPKYDSLQIGLDIADKDLRAKIAKRIKARMKNGMLAEARKLHASGLSYKRMRQFGLEYRHLADLLEKKVSLTDFEKLLELDIWHYAKRRQRAWFKRDNRIAWYKPADIKKIEKKVASFYKAPANALQ